MLVHSLGTLSKRGRQPQRRKAIKIFLSNPYILLKQIFTLVTLYVSIFVEIPLTPASPPERKDEHYFLKCQLRVEDSVEM